MSAQVIGTELWRNERTGELMETHTLKKDVCEVDIGFHKLWIGHILETIEEVGNAKVQVLFWLLKQADNNNMIKATLDDIALQTSVSRRTVASLMASLRKADVVRLEYGGRWILNPAVVFKGGHSRRMNILVRYKTTNKDQAEQVLEINKKAA